jgi:hypothetical protein
MNDIELGGSVDFMLGQGRQRYPIHHFIKYGTITKPIFRRNIF